MKGLNIEILKNKSFLSKITFCQRSCTSKYSVFLHNSLPLLLVVFRAFSLHQLAILPLVLPIHDSVAAQHCHGRVSKHVSIELKTPFLFRAIFLLSLPLPWSCFQTCLYRTLNTSFVPSYISMQFTTAMFVFPNMSL